MKNKEEIPASPLQVTNPFQRHSTGHFNDHSPQIITA